MSAAGAHDAARRVQQSPAERLRSGAFQVAVEAQELEPSDEVGCEHYNRHPVGVRLERGEREAAQPGVLQPPDVVLDVCVLAHDEVESV